MSPSADDAISGSNKDASITKTDPHKTLFDLTTIRPAGPSRIIRIYDEPMPYAHFLFPLGGYTGPLQKHSTPASSRRSGYGTHTEIPEVLDIKLTQMDDVSVSTSTSSSQHSGTEVNAQLGKMTSSNSSASASTSSQPPQSSTTSSSVQAAPPARPASEGNRVVLPPVSAALPAPAPAATVKSPPREMPPHVQQLLNRIPDLSFMLSSKLVLPSMKKR
jgi:hypothetical protein